MPIEPQQQAQHDHRDRLDERAVREHHRGDEAQHHQREVVGGAELQRELGERRREARDEHGRDAAGEERAERRDAERLARLALARHLVAVEAGHHRGDLPGQVHQDRRGRAAVLRAVVDAGQHDERGHRRQHEGRRQQHRDGRDRADAGQHADQRAEEHADEAVEDVVPVQGDAEAQHQVVEEFHGCLLRRGRSRWTTAATRCRGTAGSAASGPSRTRARRRSMRTTPRISVVLQLELVAAEARADHEQHAREQHADRLQQEAEAPRRSPARRGSASSGISRPCRRRSAGLARSRHRDEHAEDERGSRRDRTGRSPGPCAPGVPIE